MNKLHKLFALLVSALALVAFASPAAADKIFTLNMSPPSLTAGSTNQSLTATFANVSDNAGNSTAKSGKVYAPNGITILTPASGGVVNLGNGYTATIQNNGSSIFFSNLQPPLKPFAAQPLVLSMTVNVACSATGGAWAGSSPATTVWNGSSWTGQTFAYTLHPPAGNPDSQPNTGINPGCVNFTFTTNPNPSSVGPSSGMVTAKFTNTSVAANLGSAQVTAPSGLTITGGTSSNGGTVTPLGGGSSVKVEGGSAVGPGGSITLTLSVTTTPSCTGVAAAPWSNAHAYVSSTNTGTELAFQGSYPSTSVTADSCSLSFVSPPAGVAQNTAFSLTVHVTGGNGSPLVSIAATGAGCPALSGGGATGAPVGSNTTFSGLSFSGTGTCTVTANATNYDNSAATITSFKVLAGTLAACGGGSSNNANLNPNAGNALPPTDGETGYALVRGKDLDGSCPGPLIPYTFTCDPDSSIRSCVLTEVSGDQHPSVEYIILWPPVLATDDPFADKQPCVSWGVDNPQFPAVPDQYGCGGDYVPGLACKTDDVNGGSAVMPIIPLNTPPFDAASNPEPQYLADGTKRAKVCVAQHGFTAGTGDFVGYNIYWTKVIDQSDSGVRLP